MKQHAIAEAVILPVKTSMSIERRGLGASSIFLLRVVLALTFGCFVAWGQSAATSPAFLHLGDLVRAVEQFGRTNASFQMEGIVCAVGTRPGSFVFQDASAVEMVRLDPAPPGLKPGQRVRISGKQCPVTRDGYGLAMTALLIDNDGIHETLEKSATVTLRAGLHPIRTTWFNLLGGRGLKLEYQGPNLGRQTIPTNVLFHLPELTPAEGPGLTNGLEFQVYEGTWYRMPRFDRLDPVKTGLVNRFDDTVSTRAEKVAVVFSGFIQIPSDGAYTFYLSSDDGSQLFLGQPPFSLEVIGTNQIPKPQPFLGGEVLGLQESPAQWATAEGTITYLARKAGGMDLELASGVSRWRAEITDASVLAPRLLLHSRVRLTGIRRETRAFDDRRTAGMLEVLNRSGMEVLEPSPALWTQTEVHSVQEITSTNTDGTTPRLPMLVHLRGNVLSYPGENSVQVEDASGTVLVRALQRLPTDLARQQVDVLGTRNRNGIRVLENGFVRRSDPGAAGSLPVLTSIEQVQGLSRKEAEKAYKVRLRGVVTCVIMPFMTDFVLQDATRGIYMVRDGDLRPDPPEVGDSWEVEGTTSPGDFSPMVMAHKMVRLGTGPMPEPLRPTWDQLMNGSLDAQYVELQGVVTEVQPDAILLRLREGKLKVDIGTDQERLPRYENASVRLRGCLFARWSQNPARVRSGQVWFREAAIEIDKPAPLDMFDVPTKRAHEFTLFDAQSDTFQRVKVPGQIVHERRGEYFAMDGTNGIRFIPKKAQNFALGDWVEVAGFPQLEGPFSLIRDAVTRKTGHTNLPTPVLMSTDKWTNSGRDSTLVRIQAKLLNVIHGQGEDVLEMQASMRPFVARLEHKYGKLPSVAPGSLLDLIGVYSAQGRSRSDDYNPEYFELLVNSPLDITVLSRPAWWNLGHTFAVVGSLTGVLLLSTIWIRTLRRQVRVRTQELQDEVEERKKAEAQALLATEAANAASRSKSVFLANMSHEIRTPMNGVLGMNNLLLDTPLTQEQRDFAGIVKASGETLLSIINDILDFSKIEAGKLTFEAIEFDLRETVEGTLSMLAERAQAKGVELVSRIPPTLPLLFIGDPGRLRQVLQNLVGNAIKFTNRGEVVVDVSMSASEGEYPSLRIGVTDTGIGISPEARSRLFNAFEQENASTTRKFGGTGLGLAISKRLIEQMGGEIGVASRQGEGSTFWMRISLPSATKNPGPQVLENSSLKEVRVLVVDDNVASRNALNETLLAWTMRSEVSPSCGPEVVELLRQAVNKGEPFKLAVIDRQMPEMDGMALARAIKADPTIAATRIILMSPLSGPQGPGQAVPPELASVVTKPIRQSVLFGVLMQWPIPSLSAVAPKTLEQGAAANHHHEDQLRILIAEDNPVNQKLLGIQLKKLGFTADLAQDGKEVLAALRTSNYDVILMDCQMPEMDGYEVTRQIRASRDLRFQPWIIAMTANAMQGDRERCLQAGMDEYLAKPINVTALKSLLESKPARALQV